MNFFILILLLPIANCINDLLLNVTELIKSYIGLVITKNNIKIENLRYEDDTEYRPMGFNTQDEDEGEDTDE